MWLFQSTSHSLPWFTSENLLNRKISSPLLFWFYGQKFEIQRWDRARWKTWFANGPANNQTTLVSVAWHTGGNGIHLKLNLSTHGRTDFSVCRIIPFIIFRRCLEVEAKHPYKYQVLCFVWKRKLRFCFLLSFNLS